MSMDVFGLEDDSERALEPEQQPDDEGLARAPRTIDAATWAARGIVVMTLGLVAVVGGLFLGVSMTDSTPSSARPAATSSTTAPQPSETTSQTPFARVTAPPVKISTASPEASAKAPASPATAPVASIPTTRATVIQAPTSGAPSPTSTATPRGKSANTGKPKPTKP